MPEQKKRTGDSQVDIDAWNEKDVHWEYSVLCK